MGSRGRTSQASAMTVIGPAGIEATHRPKPPDELNAEEAVEWREVVNRMPADWFGRESLPLLVQWCRHVIRSRRLGEMIRRLEDTRDTPAFAPGLYLKLLRAEETQSKALTSLATKMRTSQQSSYDKSKKKPPNIAKLWDKDY